jgi:hypothetical protein
LPSAKQSSHPVEDGVTSAIWSRCVHVSPMATSLRNNDRRRPEPPEPTARSRRRKIRPRCWHWTTRHGVIRSRPSWRGGPQRAARRPAGARRPSPCSRCSPRYSRHRPGSGSERRDTCPLRRRGPRRHSERALTYPSPTQ